MVLGALAADDRFPDHVEDYARSFVTTTFTVQHTFCSVALPAQIASSSLN